MDNKTSNLPEHEIPLSQNDPTNSSTGEELAEALDPNEWVGVMKVLSKLSTKTFSHKSVLEILRILSTSKELVEIVNDLGFPDLDSILLFLDVALRKLKASNVSDLRTGLLELLKVVQENFELFLKRGDSSKWLWENIFNNPKTIEVLINMWEGEFDVDSVVNELSEEWAINLVVLVKLLGKDEVVKLLENEWDLYLEVWAVLLYSWERKIIEDFIKTFGIDSAEKLKAIFAQNATFASEFVKEIVHDKEKWMEFKELFKERCESEFDACVREGLLDDVVQKMLSREYDRFLEENARRIAEDLGSPL